jgi:hypothetical protein
VTRRLLWSKKLNDAFWSIAGAQLDEINATLPTFQCLSERPVWRWNFGKLADSNVSQPVVNLLAQLHVLANPVGKCRFFNVAGSD